MNGKSVLYNGQVLTLTKYFGEPCLFISNPSQISMPKMQFVGGYPNEYCIYMAICIGRSRWNCDKFITCGRLVAVTLVSVNGEDLLVDDCYIEECEFFITVYNFQVEEHLLTLLVRIMCGCIMHSTTTLILNNEILKD